MFELKTHGAGFAFFYENSVVELGMEGRKFFRSREDATRYIRKYGFKVESDGAVVKE